MRIVSPVDTPAFIINLDNSTHRLQSAHSQLVAAGISYVRIPAVDGRRTSPSQMPDYDESGAMKIMGRGLLGGEIGCYLSHIAAAKRFIASGAQYGLVLEDDFKFESGTLKGILKMAAWLNATGDIFDIAHISAKRHGISTPIQTFVSAGKIYQIELAHYYPMRTTGLIWTRSGAKAFIEQHGKVQMPVDLFLRYWQARRARAVSVWPGLVTTTGSPSDIHGQPGPLQPGRQFYRWQKRQLLSLDNKIRALSQKIALHGRARTLRKHPVTLDHIDIQSRLR